MKTKLPEYNAQHRIMLPMIPFFYYLLQILYSSLLLSINNNINNKNCRLIIYFLVYKIEITYCYKESYLCIIIFLFLLNFIYLHSLMASIFGITLSAFAHPPVWLQFSPIVYKTSNYLTIFITTIIFHPAINSQLFYIYFYGDMEGQSTST